MERANNGAEQDPDRDNEPSVSFRFKLPSLWREELRRQAADHGLSSGAVVRMALRRHLFSQRGPDA